MAWRRLFRPFLIDGKLENTKKGVLTLADQQRCGHLIIPEVDPSATYPSIHVLARSPYRGEEREQANTKFCEEPQV